MTWYNQKNQHSTVDQETLPKPWTEVFDEAAERIRGKIRDRAALFPRDEEIQGLLLYLADHLFDFDLDVNTWLRGCSRDARDRFVAVMGSLKPYLDEHRIAVAAETIEKTSAPIGKIGRRAGFKVPRTFQRTFERVLGVHPSDLPRPSTGSEKAVSATAAAPDPQDPVYGTRLLATYWRRQVTLGLINAERAAELRRLLRAHYEVLREVPWSRGLLPGKRIPVLRLLTGDDIEDPPKAHEPTQEAIRYDGNTARWELGRLFHEIHEHLFKPNLQLDQILEAAHLDEKKSAWRRFAAAVGQSPWSYIREARMEIAALLLLLTSLHIAKVCRRVGYTSPSAFHRLFETFAGLGPSEYRRQARRLLERGGRPPWDFAGAAYYWPKAVSGKLTVMDAVKLDEYLERLFPVEAWRSTPPAVKLTHEQPKHLNPPQP